jgi:hypothetical protein
MLTKLHFIANRGINPRDNYCYNITGEPAARLEPYVFDVKHALGLQSRIGEILKKYENLKRTSDTKSILTLRQEHNDAMWEELNVAMTDGSCTLFALVDAACKETYDEKIETLKVEIQEEEATISNMDKFERETDKHCEALSWKRRKLRHLENCEDPCWFRA